MINYDIPMPELSPNFTVDDIHKIREWNYERMKDATVEERVAFYKKAGEDFDRRMAERSKMQNVPKQ